jgi:hypothetical protein
LGDVEVGQGLARTAVELSQSNYGASVQIAQVISNEGTTTMGKAFAAAVLVDGGTPSLANAAMQNPTATSATNKNDSFGDDGKGDDHNEGNGFDNGDDHDHDWWDPDHGHDGWDHDHDHDPDWWDHHHHHHHHCRHPSCS